MGRFLETSLKYSDCERFDSHCVTCHINTANSRNESVSVRPYQLARRRSSMYTVPIEVQLCSGLIEEWLSTE